MERTIRVTGRGRISVSPDTIRLIIRSTGTYKEYSKALEASVEDTEILRKAVVKAGLRSEDLKTNDFFVNTEYESYREEYDGWSQRLKGYSYHHNMFIMFPKDNDMLGRLLTELSLCGIHAEFEIVYTVRDQEELRNELLRRAVKDSRTKAKILTEASEVSLDEIMSIDYSWQETDFQTTPLRLAKMDMAYRGDTEESGIDLDIEAADITHEDTVTVVWSIK